MKKLSKNHRLFQQKRQAVKIKRQIKFANLLKLRLITKRIKKRARNNISNSIETIIAPKEFSLSNEHNRKHLLDFLNKISAALSGKNDVIICFRKTKKLIPCGTLWATSRIEDLVKLFPNKISCTYPQDNIVEQLFQHIGLLEKLGKSPRKNIDEESVRFWHYVYGKSVDDVSKFKDLLQSSSLSEDARSGLFDSMSEAVINIIHHAYKEGQSKEWRMFAQHKDNTLTVAICDQGMGIPGSLRQKPELSEYFKSAINYAKKRSDTALIEIAVQSNRTKTKLSHRGKGLKEMLELVKSGTVGGLRILSKKGGFDYRASIDLESSKDFKTGINGTIIVWEMALELANEQ